MYLADNITYLKVKVALYLEFLPFVYDPSGDALEAVKKECVIQYLELVERWGDPASKPWTICCVHCQPNIEIVLILKVDFRTIGLVQ